jgi:CubicO group peptidase (beta-lactamase class C family)
MPDEALAGFVTETADGLGVTGAAVGVWADGREAFASHGVTSMENPLPVRPDTLFLIGSVTKTFTATAVMRLVTDGMVTLDAPVRRYVPELVLADESAADQITVLNLLNHTSGLDWGVIGDFGEGGDALARYVSALAGLPLIAPPGARASYSQAGFNLAGRIVEKVTGLTFEKAVASLVFSPVGLVGSFFDRDDIMTRRFAVGHNRGEDGTLSIGRLWRRSRGDNPGGGIASSAADMLRWARFHLGSGGSEVLPAGLRRQMQEPTTALRGSSLGDGIGIGWFLRDVGGVAGVRDVGGVRAAGHGGSANGQFADLLLVPERGFAIVALCNEGPDGIPFNQAVIRWALQNYLGITDCDPEPLPFDEARAREVAGRYENEVMTFTVGIDGAGPGMGQQMAQRMALRMEVRIKPEIRAAADKEPPPDPAPFEVGLLPRDEYIVTGGEYAGQRGFFTRDASATVTGVDLAGRLATRV